MRGDYHIQRAAKFASKGGRTCRSTRYRRARSSRCAVRATHGFEVAAIGLGSESADLAKKLGAHHYIDSAVGGPAAALQALGGAKVILITAPGGNTVAKTFKGLRPGGVSIDVGVGPEPIDITSIDLIFGERKVAGSLTGNPATGDATLRFSALSGVSAMIETVPLDQAAAAYAKMMAGQARFRMVLVMKDGSGKSTAQK